MGPIAVVTTATSAASFERGGNGSKRIERSIFGRRLRVRPEATQRFFTVADRLRSIYVLVSLGTLARFADPRIGTRISRLQKRELVVWSRPNIRIVDNLGTARRTHVLRTVERVGRAGGTTASGEEPEHSGKGLRSRSHRTVTVHSRLYSWLCEQRALSRALRSSRCRRGTACTR
jgi:hypothetical protein